MGIKIRDESKGDIEAIHRVTVLAFRDAPHTDHTEQFIVKALRQAGALFLSKVAESDGEVIGHVAISPVSVSDGSINWFGLGPISVLPEYQGKGVGAKLMENALADLRGKGAAWCSEIQVTMGALVSRLSMDYFSMGFQRNIFRHSRLVMVFRRVKLRTTRHFRLRISRQLSCLLQI